MSIGVEDEAVHAVGPVEVTLCLEHAGVVAVATLAAGCGERLGSHHLIAVLMGDGGSQIGHAAEHVAAYPELAHGHIGRGADLHRVEGTLIRLGQKPHAMLVAELAEVFIVVLGHELADGETQVPEEPFSHIATIHIVASQGGQVGGEVVMPPSGKLMLEAWCPVAAAYLVTIDERTGKSCADQRAELVDDGLDAALPEGIERLATHLVALQSVASGQRRMVGHAGGREADAQDGPVAFRHIPCQRAAGQHPVRQVDDVFTLDDGLLIHIARLWHQVALEVIVAECLLFQAVDALLALRSGKGKHGDVLVELMARLRFL